MRSNLRFGEHRLINEGRREVLDLSTSTRSEDMPAAAKVLNTTELLELILLCLPVRDLPPLQRISSKWKDTIIGSLQIQAALFRVANRSSIQASNDFSLDFDFFSEHREDTRDPTVYDVLDDGIGSQDLRGFILNPFMFSLFGSEETNFIHQHSRKCFRTPNESQSFRSMMLTAPIVKAVSIAHFDPDEDDFTPVARTERLEGHRGCCTNVVACVNNSGVTLGDVVFVVSRITDRLILRNGGASDSVLRFKILN